MQEMFSFYYLQGTLLAPKEYIEMSKIVSFLIWGWGENTSQL